MVCMVYYHIVLFSFSTFNCKYRNKYISQTLNLWIIILSKSINSVVFLKAIHFYIIWHHSIYSNAVTYMYIYIYTENWLVLFQTSTMGHLRRVIPQPHSLIWPSLTILVSPIAHPSGTTHTSRCIKAILILSPLFHFCCTQI